MNKTILSYSAPQIEMFEVAVEGGYESSTMLPHYLIEEDELWF